MTLVVYLEHSKGRKHRFYEVRVLDESLHTRWGRIGHRGCEQVAYFGTHEDALEEGLRKSAAKLKRGYHVAKAGDTPAKSPVPWRCPKTLDLFAR